SGGLSMESVCTLKKAFRSPRDISLRWVSPPSSTVERLTKERRESILGCSCP
ncbi:acylaminoacyl, partial [Cystoisospora suis]